MLYLKPANFEDLYSEYEYVKEMPIDENGLTNEFHGISKEDFEKNSLPQMINWSKGIDLPEGFVPETFFFCGTKKMAKMKLLVSLECAIILFRLCATELVTLAIK